MGLKLAAREAGAAPIEAPVSCRLRIPAIGQEPPFPTGSSQASLISELLEGQELVFAKLIHVLEAAHLAKGQMIEGLKEDMEKAQAQIEGQLGLVLDHFDDGFAPLVAEAEKIRRRAGRVAPAKAGAARPARRGRALDPHLLTGGSK